MDTHCLLRLNKSTRLCLRLRHAPTSSRLALPRRSLSTTPLRLADDPPPPQRSQRISDQFSSLSSLSASLTKVAKKKSSPTQSGYDSAADGDLLAMYTRSQEPDPPHHLHVYATKHNTHLTLTRPDRNPIISVSTGNIGFRKAGRGTYDAAYQLGAYVMGRIQEQGLLTKIERLELVLRGFGPGREAVTKVLLGSEGMGLRHSIVKVTDSTRLKFGGTRSPKPRRLG